MGNKEILTAEDNIITQNMLRTLSLAGYQIFTASHGKEAIDLARKKIPNLIILDIMMPEMDGGEVTEREEKVQTKKDATSFISKPYTRDKLLNEVKKHFN